MVAARAALPVSPAPPLSLGKKLARGVLVTPSSPALLPQDRKLARDVLEDFMLTFAGMATHYQPRPPGEQPNPHADEEQFWKFAKFAIHCAAVLAPYQSPTFRAIVAPPPPEPERCETDKRFGLGEQGRPVDPAEAARVYRRLVTAALENAT
jgi:hypothetical protein